jgi:PKD repeat protein
MKKITFKFLLFASLLFAAAMTKAQTCTASFNYSMLPNGGVIFFSTSTTATINSQYYWFFGNSNTYTATGSTTATTTYTANGTYTVSLLFLNPSTCSNVATSVITVTNVSSSGCNLNVSINWSSSSNGYFFFSSFPTGTTSGTTYLWNFGDNSSSTSASPGGHTYASNGTYTVTLLANNNSTPTCVDSAMTVITVSTVCNLNAAFTYTVSGGNVFVTNNTTPSLSASSYTWSSSNGQLFVTTNPVFTYTANGTYTIGLFAQSSSPPCNNWVVQTVTITNSSTCNIAAGFIYTKLQNGVVSFTNTSVGTNTNTTYTWNFGDSGSSTQTNPFHTYASNGSYVVTLTASNGGTCTSTTTMTIVINNICNLAASFSYTAGSNGQVNFASTSTGTQGSYLYAWSFGDQTSASGSTANHTYLNGTYVVVLSVSNSSISPTCTSSATQTITVTSSTCIADASFSVVPTSTAQYWNAYPSSPSNVTSAQWSWGDGSFSDSLYTSHQYSAAGTYDLCLSVTVSCGATDTYCAPYSIYRTSGNNSVVYVNVIDPASVGLNEQLAATKMSVFPNPTKGAFTIQLSQKTGVSTTVNLYNITGARVQQNMVPEGARDISVDASSLPEGIYFLKLETQNKGTVVQKIVIDR